MICDGCGRERDDIEEGFCGICRQDIVLTLEDMELLLKAVSFMKITVKLESTSKKYVELLDKLYDIMEM